jgi:Flp pilus assembly protein TadG
MSDTRYLSRIFRPVRGGRGVSVVEFALVLPLLLGLVFAIVDFGLYFFIQHTVQFATREGVRLALVGRTLNDAAGDPLSREASIIKKISDEASIAINPSALQISIYPVSANYGDPIGWQNTQDAGPPGAFMRVRTRYDYKFITPLLGVMANGGKLAIEAQATYRNELFSN